MKEFVFELDGSEKSHSPPLVKLLAKGMSKCTGAIFGILDARLSVAKQIDTTHGTHNQTSQLCSKPYGVWGPH